MSTSITVEQAFLTPELAAQLLTTNVGNRPLKRGAIARYADDMINGRWQNTGEPIKIDKNGTLLDGQNRCLAVQLASELKGKPVSIPVLIVRGLEAESQDAMDTGKPRTVSDQLARREVANYARTAAAIRLIVQYNNGALTGDRSINNRKAHPSHAEQLAFFDAHIDEIVPAIEASSEWGNTSGINGSVQAAARYLITEVVDDTDAIEEFFTGLRGGAGLPSDSPILALRNRMRSVRIEHERVGNNTLLLLLLRVWNAWRKGEPMTKLPIRTRSRLTNVDTIVP